MMLWCGWLKRHVFVCDQSERSQYAHVECVDCCVELGKEMIGGVVKEQEEEQKKEKEWGKRTNTNPFPTLTFAD